MRGRLSRAGTKRPRWRTLAAGRSGSAAGQRLQRSSVGQLPEAPHDCIEHRLGRLRIDLRLALDSREAIELTGELLLKTGFWNIAGLPLAR